MIVVDVDGFSTITHMERCFRKPGVTNRMREEWRRGWRAEESGQNMAVSEKQTPTRVLAERHFHRIAILKLLLGLR